MTATLPTRAATPDLATVVKREDSRWAQENGDEPSNPDYLARLVDAVQQQYVDQFTAGSGTTNPAEVEQLHADNARLADQLQKTTREAEVYAGQVVQLNEDLQTEKRRADNRIRSLRAELAERKDTTEHKHHYEWPAPDKEPLPCACGQVYPRGKRTTPAAGKPSTPDPWADMFGRIRGELAGWST